MKKTNSLLQCVTIRCILQQGSVFATYNTHVQHESKNIAEHSNFYKGRATMENMHPEKHIVLVCGDIQGIFNDYSEAQTMLFELENYFERAGLSDVTDVFIASVIL